MRRQSRRGTSSCVFNLIRYAGVAAATPSIHPCPPLWFWAEQYDLKLQMAGLSQGYDRTVLRGDIAKRSFSAFYLREGRLIAVDVVNRPAEFMLARQALAKDLYPDPDALTDESIALKSVLT